MLGQQERWQEDLFVAGSLRDLIPEDHILRRVDRVLDLAWLRGAVADCYCTDNGRPGIDPEAAVRLMLAGFLLGIVHDRKLLREAQVNLAIRWFAGYRLHERLPDHSSLTRIRQRWGERRFREIFERTVTCCVEAGIASGEVVHIDATLIRADVSWDSMVERHATAVLDGDATAPAAEPGSSSKRVSRTDPDATLATGTRRGRMEPRYKQHTAVDDQAGVIVDVALTTGSTNEGDLVETHLDNVAQLTGRPVKVLTADAGYAYAKTYRSAEQRGVDPVIPPKAEPPPKSRVPLRRFRYDARNDIVRCPAGKTMRPSARAPHGRFFRARTADCRRCALRAECLPRPHGTRSVVISDGYDALLRARRRRPRWTAVERQHYQRHRWRAEGIFAEAKAQHGLRRAVRRRRWNVAVQAYLTAAAINLKRLAAAFPSLGARMGWLGSAHFALSPG